jgi:hypothetical protein
MMNNISPGDHIIIEGMTYDSYVVCRVAKIGKIMWEVEQLRWNGEYDTPARRKVTRPRAYRGNNPLDMALELKRLKDELWAKQSAIKVAYHAEIAKLPGVEK